MGGAPAIVKKVASPVMSIVTPEKPKPVSTTPAPQPVTPTQAEVSQSAATDAEGLTKAQRARRKGRSATILTSTAGVQDETTLGTKSLLGE